MSYVIDNDFSVSLTDEADNLLGGATYVIPVFPDPASLLTAGVTGKGGTHLFGFQVQGQDPTTVLPLCDTLGRPPQMLGLFEDWSVTPAAIAARLALCNTQQAVPLITWQPAPFGSTVNNLAAIAAGSFDSYITSIAQQFAAYGKPCILRFAHEMNGNWYPWGQDQADYISAWRHVHSLFVSAGAANVLWFWCPNANSSASDSGVYYPGGAYVDIIGLDGYNTSNQGSTWRTPSQVFQNCLAYIEGLTDKAIMLGEVGCEEAGTSGWPSPSTMDSKSDWISDLFTLLGSHPRVIGFLWPEWDVDKLESSAADTEAMSNNLVELWE